MNSNLKSESECFLPAGHDVTRKPKPWAPHLITAEAIAAEVSRLSAQPRPRNGRRSSTMTHPRMRDGVPGLTPATDVVLSVLLPGEKTLHSRCNTNQIEVSIQGTGQVDVEGHLITGDLHDVWNIPSMRVHAHTNNGSQPWVRLTYSNAPLLDYLGVLFSEEGDAIKQEETAASSLKTALQDSIDQKYVRGNAPDLQILNRGARLRGYEYLTDIEVKNDFALHWPFNEIDPLLPEAPGDGKRSIWLMYNPVTERRAGSSNSFFATWAGGPKGMSPLPTARGHRHSSASINYHAQGHGISVVDGVTVAWKAGDLLLSAPSWSEHIHYPGSDGFRILTVQDHPMHIALGSLLWQEKMDHHIFMLGAEGGQTGYTGPRERGT